MYSAVHRKISATQIVTMSIALKFCDCCRCAVTVVTACCLHCCHFLIVANTNELSHYNFVTGCIWMFGSKVHLANFVLASSCHQSFGRRRRGRTSPSIWEGSPDQNIIPEDLAGKDRLLHLQIDKSSLKQLVVGIEVPPLSTVQ